MVVKVRKKKKEGKRRGNPYLVVFRNLIPTAGDINKVRYEKVVVVLSLARFPGLISGMPSFLRPVYRDKLAGKDRNIPLLSSPSRSLMALLLPKVKNNKVRFPSVPIAPQPFSQARHDWLAFAFMFMLPWPASLGCLETKKTRACAVKPESDSSSDENQRLLPSFFLISSTRFDNMVRSAKTRVLNGCMPANRLVTYSVEPPSVILGL